MQYKLKPYPHQEYIIQMAREKGNIGMFWDMGAGKTGGMINILRDLYAKEGRLMRTLIVSPLVTLYNWKNEFDIHSYVAKDDIHVLHKGGTKGKVKKFTNVAMNKATGVLEYSGIFITNYESLRAKELHDLLMEWSPEIMILDEAHYIKNPRSKQSKGAIKLGDRTGHKFILTGTPILNSIKDLYNLFRFLDSGETFGRNYNVFLSKYMQDENASWSQKPGYFPSLVPREDMYGELQDKIYKKCHRVTTKDVLKDLPPLVKVVRQVELGTEQRKYYNEMKRDFVTFVQEKQKNQELSGAVVAQVAVTKALRLQQITTGYVQTDEGEVIEIQNNPRLDEVKNLLQEIVVDGNNKCILWCSFRHNYKQLSKLCSDMNINHVFITGDMSLEDKTKSMEDFNTREDTPVIIANRRAGGIGINLTAANYSIVYSRNFSLGEELQSERRNYRGGSQVHDKIIKIDLCARDTIDEHVLEALKNKDDISKRIVDLVKEV